MNDKIKMITVLSDYLTDKEVGILIKQSGLEEKLQEEVLVGVNDAFYGRLTKLAQEVGNKASQKMLDMIGEDYSESEILVEVLKITLSMLDRMKDLEGYEEYEILATDIYGKYDLNYSELQDATNKMRELLGKEEVVEKMFKELD